MGLFRDMGQVSVPKEQKVIPRKRYDNICKLIDVYLNTNAMDLDSCFKDLLASVNGGGK